MRRSIPSTQSLLCFDAAARHMSYTRAAQELALTQSAVSRQVAALEEYLGHRLFARTRYGLTLTPRGQAYARQVAERLGALERDTLDAMAGAGTHGTVQLAAVATFAARWLIPRLGHLRARHPQVVVHIETRTRPFLFADTSFDAALYAGTPEQLQRWAGTQATRLLAEVTLPVCAPSLLGGRVAPGTADALTHLPLLQHSTRPFAWRQWFEAQGLAVAQALSGPRYELFSMTISAAIHGQGLALVPRLLIEDELARGDLVVACNHALQDERAYYLVTPLRDAEPAALQDFRQWLLEVVGTDPTVPPPA